jgi:hypothetical protein
MSKEIVMNFKDGIVETLYEDDLNLDQIGEMDIRRASHVEPNNNGKWIVDLSPVNGPKLGPFKKRKDALKAEVKWINKNYFNKKNAL